SSDVCSSDLMSSLLADRKTNAFSLSCSKTPLVLVIDFRQCHGPCNCRLEAELLGQPLCFFSSQLPELVGSDQSPFAHQRSVYLRQVCIKRAYNLDVQTVGKQSIG